MAGPANEHSARLCALIDQCRPELDALLAKYGASNPRLFGSVARGEAREDSDIDIMVDVERADPDLVWELGALSMELEEALGVKVDVVCEKILRAKVSHSAVEDLVAL